MEGSPIRCSNCSEIPPEKIYMCRNGHAICKRCYNLPTLETCPISTCPIELNKLDPIRGRNLEEILRATSWDCKFKVNGCNKRLLGIELCAHEHNCKFESARIKSFNKFFRIGAASLSCILIAAVAVYFAPFIKTGYSRTETSEEFSNENDASRNYGKIQTYDLPYTLLENTIKLENKELALVKLKLLFENGQFSTADPHLQQNLLLYACSNSNAQIVKYLIKEGFLLNVLSTATLLHAAVLHKNNEESLEICKILLENGVDCNIESKHDQVTPLKLAQLTKGPEYSEELEQLYNKLNPSCTPIRDRSYFKEILEGQKNSLGVSSLSTDLVKEWTRNTTGFVTWDGLKYFLEEAGEEEIDINSVECGDLGHKYNLTYLHLILLSDRNKTRGLEKIKFLVEEKGANVHAKDVWGMSLLHAAAEYYTADSVEYFLSKGLDVNGKGTEGQTPLSQSLLNKDEGEGVRIAITLLKNGAECETLQKGDYKEEERRRYKTRLNSLYTIYKPSCLF